MKNTAFSVHTLCTGVSLCCLLLGGCTKEATAPLRAAAVSISNSSDAITADAINQWIELKGVLGTYTVRDEKTIFIGQANANGTNVLVHLDYLDVEKDIRPAADKKHLTCAYGPETTKTEGWAYLIGYNRNTHAIVLTPNEPMKAGIVPNSFKQLVATYDVPTETWTFVTRYTGLTDNGNESQVGETFWKQ